jgi:hypothetical protein
MTKKTVSVCVRPDMRATDEPVGVPPQVQFRDIGNIEPSCDSDFGRVGRLRGNIGKDGGHGDQKRYNEEFVRGQCHPGKKRR